MAIIIGINELKDLANKMSEKTGYPFSDMHYSFLKRRLLIFFEKNKLRSLDQFTNQLDNSYFKDALMSQFPVECTELFRDPGFWRSLNTKVLPKINGSSLPIWFPDASSGEEVMSLLILLEINNMQPKVIFNHPSNEKLAEIGQGLVCIKDMELAESNFKRLELNLSLSDYLLRSNQCMRLKPKMVENLIGEKGWFLNEPKGTPSLSLIIMRNTALYLNKTMHEKLMHLVYNLLSPGGYLAIGIKEYLPASILEKMEAVDKQEQIYKKPGILTA